MNKAILMGRLTKDPELRYTSTNNTPVCTFTLAVDRKFTKQGEEKQTDFIPVVMWNKTAEVFAKYMQKGRQVLVAGRIQTRTWDDAEGKRHYVTEVVADEFDFLDYKKGEGTGEKADYGFTESNEQTEGFYTVDDDDELPF